MNNVLIRLIMCITTIVSVLSQSTSGETNSIGNNNVCKASWELASRWHPLSILSKIGSVNVNPHWIDSGDCFWYKYKKSDGIDYWLINPEDGKKEALFNIEKLVSELQKAVDSQITAASVSIRDISAKEHGRIIEFTINESRFRYDNENANLLKISKSSNSRIEEWLNLSPDSSIGVYVRGNNLFLTESYDGKERDTQLTIDGAMEYSWGQEWDIINNSDTSRYYVDALWSPDSRKFAILRADLRSVENIQIMDYLHRPRPKLRTLKYPFPCEAVPKWELWIYDADMKKIGKIDIDRWADQVLLDLTSETVKWSHDSKTLYFIRKSRDHHSVDVCAVDLETWSCRTVIEERLDCQVFIHPLVQIRTTGELLWWSMRDGRGHYYLYSPDGELINQVTSGSVNAVEIVSVDDENRILYFLANKDDKDANPYLDYLYKVNLDGSGQMVITPEEADHDCEFSPDGHWFVDNYSRVDMPTLSVLRDSNGKIVLELETADITELKREGWQPPIIFSAKAADGITDLWGIMELPYNLDKTKKYPVIARVYPGRHTESLPSDFWPLNLEAYLAQYGFIVLQFGNRGGSPHRGLDYWKYGRDDFRDYGLEDKKVVIEQLAARYDFIDLERVGIFGGSSGGFMTVTSMLVYPDFFDVGVAMTAPNDPGLYHNVWFERYQGFSQNLDADESNAPKCDIPTNLELAKNLKGRLLMIYGGQDKLVQLSQLFGMADAFIKEGKHFDMFIIPDADHGLGDWRYRYSLVCGYFVEHLLGDKSVGIDLLVE